VSFTDVVRVPPADYFEIALDGFGAPLVNLV
jgi:hypothetical protein